MSYEAYCGFQWNLSSAMGLDAPPVAEAILAALGRPSRGFWDAVSPDDETTDAMNRISESSQQMQDQIAKTRAAMGGR